MTTPKPETVPFVRTGPAWPCSVDRLRRCQAVTPCYEAGECLRPPSEHERRVAIIRDNMPALRGLLADVRRNNREVSHWRLPEAWDPGPDPTDPRPVRVLGYPVTFAGDHIEVVLAPTEWDRCRQCAQPLAYGRHPTGSRCPRRTLANPNRTQAQGADQ